MDNQQTFFVTGCASGIGRHLAVALMQRGFRGFYCDVNHAGLETLATEPGWSRQRGTLHAFDVREHAAWDDAVVRAVDALGRIDVLLNVAGYLRPGWVHASDAQQIDIHMDVNAKGLMLGTQAVARRMVEQGAGHIINFGSIAALAPVPGLALYTASKFAVRGFTLAIARELRPHGVFVTLINPDAVQTPMLDVQLDYIEAALTFSGPRTLTPLDIERLLFDRVLSHRPLEVSYPASRGWLARLSNVIPGLTGALMPRLARRGQKRQDDLRQRRADPQNPGAR